MQDPGRKSISLLYHSCTPRHKENPWCAPGVCPSSGTAGKMWWWAYSEWVYIHLEYRGNKE